MLNNQHNKISVCVCTYFRKDLLQKSLESLGAQDFPKNRFEIIVVDNDKFGSAEDVILDFLEKNPDIRIVYAIEPNQGISYARNTAVSLAKGEFIAFIDDDEKAEKKWLSTMVETIDAYQADAVIGPVVSIYPQGAPEWIIGSQFFERPRFSTGDRIQFGDARTGNALIKSKWLNARKPFPFSLTFTYSGGEDSDFFQWMEDQKCRMVWCDTAIVTEEVPIERLTFYFITERSFRASVVYWRERYKRQSFQRSLYKVLEGIVIIPLLIFAAIIVVAIKKDKALKFWVRAVKLSGRLMAFSSINLVGYGEK